MWADYSIAADSGQLPESRFAGLERSVFAAAMSRCGHDRPGSCRSLCRN